MDISGDRWTCPACDRTIVVRMRAAAGAGLRAAQERHATEHAMSDRAPWNGSRAGERYVRGAVRPPGSESRLALEGSAVVTPAQAPSR